MNFKNESFKSIFDGITRFMPGATFWGIIATYAITAALSVYFLDLPLFISIPTALAIQFGRFAVVFKNFLNPVGRKDALPVVVALVATMVALFELGYSLADFGFAGNKFWSVYLFGAMIIVFGAILELNFINEGERAFGLSAKNQIPYPTPSAQVLASNPTKNGAITPPLANGSNGMGNAIPVTMTP